MWHMAVRENILGAHLISDIARGQYYRSISQPDVTALNGSGSRPGHEAAITHHFRNLPE